MRKGENRAEMGKQLGIGQSAISKIEAGVDADLTIYFIRSYAKATNERVCIMFGKPMNHVESVKAHAIGIKRHLSEFAKLADEDMEKEISAFFGEAFFNLLTILSKCDGELQNGNQFEATPVYFFNVDKNVRAPLVTRHNFALLLGTSGATGWDRSPIDCQQRRVLRNDLPTDGHKAWNVGGHKKGLQDSPLRRVGPRWTHSRIVYWQMGPRSFLAEGPCDHSQQ